MQNKKISCVISCHNEEKNILLLIDQIKKNNLEKNYQFILVNNASTDKSWGLITNIKDKFPEIKFINIEKNLGWGNGITEGLKHATCEFVGWTHGDLQYNLNSLLKVEELLNDNKNRHDNILIKGRRKKRNFSDAIFTFFMSIIASVVTGKIMYDINAQPSFFSKNLLKEFENTPKDLMLDIYLYYKILKRKNNQVIRIPVLQEKRIFGSSSWNKSFISKLEMAIKQFIGILKVRF